MAEKLRVFIAEVIPKGTARSEEKARMDELVSLVNTLGGIVIVQTIQKRTLPDYRTFLGSGKLKEIKEEMLEKEATVLIIGNAILPRQIYTINESLKDIHAQCRDRVDLILKIFEKHADSTEARLQIELAAIKHMWPRIVGMGMELSRQWWGIGTSGIGETNTEIMRRHLKQKRIVIEKKLQEYEKMRKLHREGRKRKGLQTIGIVWYTNAGKSTLLQALTNKEAYKADKLFATLGTQVGEMIYYPPINDKDKNAHRKPIQYLISDTIGFIRDLPPHLIQAFKSTLEDSIESDLLLHVVDASDPEIAIKIKVVDDILQDIGATQVKLYIFNKCDSITAGHKKELKKEFYDLQPIFTSAETGHNIDSLKEAIHQKIH